MTLTTQIRKTAPSRLFDRPPEALALGLLLLGACVSLLIGVLAPMSDQAPVVLGIVLTPVALALGVGTIAFANRIPRWAFAVEAVVVVVLNSVVVAAAATTGGAMVDAIAFFWLAVYMAIFFPAVAGAFAVFVGVAFGAGLLAGGLPGMLSAWAITSVTIVIASAVLVRLSRQVRVVVEQDTLTGALTRAAFLAAAERELGQARRRREPLAVVAIDFDGFKLVNDRHGHAAGDRLLREVATAWRSALRAEDVLGRIGGDEFVVLLPNTEERGAGEAIARLRATHGVAWSAGVAVWRDGESFEACLARADARLYEAKALPAA